MDLVPSQNQFDLVDNSFSFVIVPDALQGADQVIPVDMYVAGCPPTPEQLLAGLLCGFTLLDGATQQRAGAGSRRQHSG